MSDSQETTFCQSSLPPQLKKYSLVPDLVMGWKPKNMKTSAPIVILYRSLLIQQMLEYYSSTASNIIYLGNRFADSYSFHEHCQHDYTLKSCLTSTELASILPHHASSKSLLRPFVGMNPTVKDQFLFDSNFESGNLDAVFRAGKNQYNLFLRPDTNTCGHMQWFYFKVRNSCTRQRVIKINICNNKKQNTLFQRGMKPYIRSKYLNKGWQQGGMNISYTRLSLKEQNVSQDSHKVNLYANYYNLHFQYQFQCGNDQVQFAYCIPYTYSDLRVFLKKLKRVVQDNTQQNQQSILTEDRLCYSLSGLEIPCLTITEASEGEKITILVTARIHPGESNSSHAVEGFLEWVVSSRAYSLRRRAIIVVVPMLNPDGVVFGNYRTGLGGKDLNRQFKCKSIDLFPQVSKLKELARKLSNRPTYYLDFHGHSLKKNVFVYGPQYQIWTTKYQRARLLPKVIGQMCDSFREKSCLFKVASFKRTTARAFMLSLIPYCYTVESSVGLYHCKEGMKVFGREKWQEVGKVFGQAIAIMEDGEDKVSKGKKKNHQQKESYLERKYTSAQSKKRLEPIKSIGKELVVAECPQIDQEMCESDGFSQGNSDAESQSNDLTKEEYNQLKRKIKELVEEFGLFLAGKYQSKTSLKKNIRMKVKSKNKIIQNTTIIHQQMKMVPSLRHKLKIKKNKKLQLSSLSQYPTTMKIGSLIG